VPHPSLGVAPQDLTAGFRAGAERLRAARSRLGARALEVALELDPSIAERHGELGMRKLLRDTEPLIDRLAIAVAAKDPTAVAAWADWVAPLYRRGRIPMDDLIHLCEGLEQAVPAVLAPEERPIAIEALEEAIRILRWNRRLAGDARKRNRIISAIYKGA
jgi:hypothetical protein